MTKRIVFGALLIAIVVGIFALDLYILNSPAPACRSLDANWPGLPVAAVLVALTAVGYVELTRLIRAGDVRLLVCSGALLAVAFVLLAWLPDLWQAWPWRIRLVQAHLARRPLIVLACGLMLVFAEQMLRHRLADALRTVAATVFGAAYLGLGMAAMLSIRLDHGLWLLLTVLAAVKFTDIGAYFTGSFLGKHKMIPWLSPGKSWEGLIGGLAAAAVVAWAMGYVVPSRWPGFAMVHAADPWWGWLIFGAVLGLVGQFGDLCESLLKRSAGAKDSGALVPEFGGILDMVDSPLLAAPVAWLLLAFGW